MPFDFNDYLRLDKMPHIWCSGCGNGIALMSVLRAIDNLKLEKSRVVMVSGIGCSSRAVGYVDFNTLHTAHGRAIPFATGIKLANPRLHVIVVAGDGDIIAIGGNHFIHAARRNIDITVIMFNNANYGMTSGQYSPLTPINSITSTSKYGAMERAFDMCQLAQAAGAVYVARGTTYHVRLLDDLIKQAVQIKGFSFVEIISACPTYYGRYNKYATPVDMLKWQRDSAVNLKQAGILNPEELKTKFVIGELYKKQDEKEYIDAYKDMTKKIRVSEGISEEPEETEEETEYCEGSGEGQ